MQVVTVLAVQQLCLQTATKTLNYQSYITHISCYLWCVWT